MKRSVDREAPPMEGLKRIGPPQTRLTPVGRRFQEGKARGRGNLGGMVKLESGVFQRFGRRIAEHLPIETVQILFVLQ